MNFRAVFDEEAQTRAALSGSSSDAVRSLVWAADDSIMVSNGLGVAKFINSNASASANAVFKGQIASGKEYYAAYPYGRSVSFSDGAFCLDIPQRQKYYPDGVDPKALLMVAKGVDGEFRFKNVCGIVVVNLKGEGEVKSLSFSAVGADGKAMKIAGKGKVMMNYTNAPTLVMDESAGSSVTLDCLDGSGNGVRLTESGTSFHLVLPAGLYSSFTVRVRLKDDSMKKTSVNPMTVKRSERTTMSVIPFESSGNDLSSDGTANCYLVTSLGEHVFDATVKGNSDELVGNAVSAKVLWSTLLTDSAPSADEVISDVVLEGGDVMFNANRNGNAGIAVLDADGNILWSWHIWIIEGYDAHASSHLYYDGAGIFMDRNLGALVAEASEDNTSRGFRYQWGRKDPFAGHNYYTAQGYDFNWLNSDAFLSEKPDIEYTVRNPMKRIEYYGDDYNIVKGDWLYNQTADRKQVDTLRWARVKTKYDPCPPGWRVPDESFFRVCENLSVPELTDDQLRNIIIEYDDLNTVPATKLYRRLYHQMTDTADRKAGIYYYDFVANEWIPFEQDTATVALNDPTTEIWEVEKATQQEFNRDIAWNLRNVILYSSDLDLVEDAKKYKRLYYQTVDTVARKQGLYYYDFAINEWVALDGNTERTPLTDPTGVEKFEVERANQKEWNADIVNDIKQFIRYAEDLDTVETDKRYKRIYKQTTDTALRNAGYYAWDTDKNDWVSVGGGATDAVMLTDVELESMALDAKTQMDVNEANKKIISRMLYMPVFSRVEPWLYEADYKNAQVDEAFAREYINEHGGKLSVDGACTAVYNNGYFLKNYDWYFSNSEAIVVKILGGFYNVLGTACGIKLLDKDYCEQLLADKTEWNDILRVLPFYVNEGFNDVGLFVGLNIVPAHETLEGAEMIPTTGTGVGDKTAAGMIPSLILQNCGSAAEARTYINALNIYCPEDRELHLMIGDSSGALWLLEFINNVATWTNMAAANKAPYMTNYYQTYANYGADKKLIDHNHIGNHPNGVHRGDIVADNLSSIASVDSALDFLQNDVKYTNTYIDSWNWIDEFCGNDSVFGDLTIQMADSTPTAFTPIISWAQNEYATRDRDSGTTWQTVFSAVDDINAKKKYVVVQEQGIAYQHMFELDDTPVEIDHHVLVDELPTSDIEQKNLYLVKDETEVGKIDTVAKYDGANWWTAAVNNNGIGVGEVFPSDPYLNQVFIISYDD